MPTYIYGCTADTSHPRVDVVHGMDVTAYLHCSECGEPMRKYPPKGVTFSMGALSVLYDWCDYNWRKWKAGRPRFSPDQVNRPEKPLPQKDFSKRR